MVHSILQRHFPYDHICENWFKPFLLPFIHMLYEKIHWFFSPLDSQQQCNENNGPSQLVEAEIKLIS